MESKLDQIIQILKNPVALHSISKDLKEYDRENGTNTYENFKSTILEIDPSVNFERVEIDFVANMAKMKL